MASHLVLVGGGHAHLTVLSKLAEFTGKGHRATLVAPGPYHYYSGMGPGLLGGFYEPRQIRFNVRKMARDRGAEFLQDKVTQVDPDARTLELQSGRTLSYDVASFNVGSDVPAPFLAPEQTNVFMVKPIQQLYDARERIRESIRHGIPRIAIVGGGPAALETAGNVERLVRNNLGKALVTVFAGPRFLGHMPERVRRLALRSLEGRAVRVEEGSFVQHMADGRLTLEDGSVHPYDLAIVGVGVKAPELFSRSGMSTGNNGELLVNEFLQSVDAPNLFGGGDCIELTGHPLDKVGVYAVRQNPILCHNLMAALEGGEMRTFQPQSRYMLILNPGDGRGVLVWRGLAVEGPLMFRLKDHIDRKFMKKFQISGEPAEIQIR